MSSLRKSLFYRIDGIVLMLYVSLVIVGILAVFSVEHRTTDLSLFMMNKSYMKQLIWFGYSLVIGMMIMLTDSKFFSSFAFLAYTIGVAILIITIFAGVDVKGSRSWLGVGSFRFQPAGWCCAGHDSCCFYTITEGDRAGAGVFLLFPCYVSRGASKYRAGGWVFGSSPRADDIAC